jgi:hypothetical protein
MTWTEKLKEFSGLATETPRTEVTDLLPTMSLALDRLYRVAALAPNPTMQAEIAPVVARAESVLQRVRDLVRDFGPVRTPPGPNVRPDGQNHWARLLEALEQHREVRQRLREISISLEETNPTLSHALSDVRRDEDRVIERLRDLIAHADPQALN